MDNVIALKSYLLKLKSLKRKGWVLRGISDTESVADHSYSVSMLVMVMAEKLKLDTEECIKIALIHDLAESVVGDLTPFDDKYSKKKELEDKAMTKIIEETGLLFIGQLWKEYMEQKTTEAKLVSDMDKIEMVIQALDYKRRYPEKNLDEFLVYVKGKLQLEDSMKLYEKLLRKGV